MRSRVASGEVSHARTGPGRIRNTFRYPIYYLWLDLDELDTISASSRRLSHNSPNLVSVWDRDHGPRDGSRLRQWIERVCQDAGLDFAVDHVMMLTFPRILGARFYPVTFWYVYGTDHLVHAVLAEVHNTFRDRHSYVLHDGGAPFDWSRTHLSAKAFYVSPFIRIEDVTYEFTLAEPGEHLAVRITDIVDGSRLLTAAIALDMHPLDDAALVSQVLRHGPVSIVALVRIHWQALKLLFKGAPFHPHQDPPDREVSL